jgi:diaminopimelate decarboxylase
VFAQEGLGCDVASAGELRIALAAGFPGDRILLHGNAKRDEEIALALEHRIRYVVIDGFDDIDRLARLAHAPQDVLVRVNPGVVADTPRWRRATRHRSSGSRSPRCPRCSSASRPCRCCGWPACMSTGNCLTLYRVVTVKRAGRTFVAVDGGMADNLEPALYDVRFAPLVLGHDGPPVSSAGTASRGTSCAATSTWRTRASATSSRSRSPGPTATRCSTTPHARSGRPS